MEDGVSGSSKVFLLRYKPFLFDFISELLKASHFFHIGIKTN